MALFDFFRRRKSRGRPVLQKVSLPQTCYEIAYFLLPPLVFDDLEKVVEMCTQRKEGSGPLMYFMACQLRGFKPDLAVAPSFHWHHDSIEEGRDCFVLEYPAPPPVDFGDDPVATLTSGDRPVLAPHFSAVVTRASAEPDYYVLGQAPLGGGTTLRSVLRDGSNCNLGPGPAPSLDNFLAAVANRQKD